MSRFRQITDQDREEILLLHSQKKTKAEICKALHIALETLRRWRKNGDIDLPCLPRGSHEALMKGLMRCHSDPAIKARQAATARRNCIRRNVEKYEADLCEVEIPSWIPARDVNEFCSLVVTKGSTLAYAVMEARHAKALRLVA